MGESFLNRKMPPAFGHGKEEEYEMNYEEKIFKIKKYKIIFIALTGSSSFYYLAYLKIFSYTFDQEK
jgi:hypothetical protein